MLKFAKINDLLINSDLFRFHGMLEYWNVGVRVKQTHHSINPSFLSRETFFYFTEAIIPSGFSKKATLNL
jgi:hypothetical protein